MPLSKISWLTAVVAALIASVLVLANGYEGYALVLLAIAASAAVNLR